MPSQIKLYRGVWCEVWYEGGKTRRASLGTTDFQEAQRRLAQVEDILKTPSEITVAWLWNEYVQENEGKAVLVTMVHTWKSLRPHFGYLLPNLIKRQNCKDYIESRRASGIADGTIWTELGHLSTVMNFAEKNGRIQKAPHIHRPKKPDPVDRYLKKAEVKLLIECATKPHVKLAITIMSATGARIGAVSELTWDRCDFERRLITFKRPEDLQRRKGRPVVPMNDTVYHALLEAKSKAMTEHVITWGDKPVKSLKRSLATASAKAGLKRVTAHLLRHSAAVWMAEEGNSMSEIAQFLGHSDSRITEKVYAKYSPDYLRKTAKATELDM